MKEGGKKLLKINLVEIKKYLLAIWIILLSGVWTINLPSLLIVGINFILLFFFLIKMISQYKIIKGMNYLIIIILLLLSAFITNSDYSAWMSYTFILSYCVIALYISNYWKKGEFLNKYSNIILIICFISIVMYSFRGVLVNHQSGFPIVQGKSISYTNFYIYLYCRELPDRNCAIFWEPGAFAVFIGIALYNTLITDKKNKYYKLIVYFIAMLTTYSTLAYILMLFALLMFVMKKKKNNMVSRTAISIIIVLIILLIMNELGVYQNIQDKLFEGLNTNTSSKARNIGQMIDMKIIQTSPVFGVGFSRYSELVPYIGMLLGEKWTVAANTFTYTGAIFGLIYLLIILRGIIKFCKNDKNAFFILVSIIYMVWLFTTQNFVEKPILYCLIFLGFTNTAFEYKEGGI